MMCLIKSIKSNILIVFSIPKGNITWDSEISLNKYVKVKL